MKAFISFCLEVMKLFQKARGQQAYLKVAIYGEAGSGKTYTALRIGAALGKVAVIDTEHGTDFYSKMFDFDVLHTRSLKTALDAVFSDEIKNYDVLIVDSITHLWESAQESYLEMLKRSKDPKKRARAEAGEIQFQDWRAIKAPYRKFINRLLSLDLHVFICGRLGTIYEFRDGELVKAGVRMRAEGDTPYEPHILIRMEQKNGRHFAFVEKDRSNTIMGKVFENPDASMFEPVFKMLGGEQAKVEDSADEKLFLADKEQVDKLRDLIGIYSTIVEKDPQDIERAICEKFKVNSLEELEAQAAELIIADLSGYIARKMEGASSERV